MSPALLIKHHQPAHGCAGKPLPLCVDLDGTLIHSDTLVELFIRLLRHRPLAIFLLPFWLLRGRALLKYRMSKLAACYINVLPFNESLVKFLREKKAAGHPLYLVTACEQQLAEKVAAMVGLFDAVWGSSEQLNLKAGNKAERLIREFGDNGFIYAGNSTADLKVWRYAHEIILVNAGSGLRKTVLKENPGKAVTEFPLRRFTLKVLLKAMRIHQWAKNLLIFVPLFLAHTYSNMDNVLQALLAFLSFGLCASSTYILNDSLDIESDRLHAHKRTRALASGLMPIPIGLVVMVCLMGLACAVASYVSTALLGLLALYVVITVSYSFWLKRVVTVDVLVLSILYMIRIQYGSVAIQTESSFWLLSFAVFIFLSLGFLKRYIELLATAEGQDKISGRSYVKGDDIIVAIMGISSGMISVMLYIMYIDSGAAYLYARPDVLIFGVLLLIYFLCRIWISAHRGEVHSDPIVHVLGKKEYYVVGILFLIIFLSAGPVGNA